MGHVIIFTALYERSCEAYRGKADPSGTYTLDLDGSGPLESTPVTCSQTGNTTTHTHTQRHTNTHRRAHTHTHTHSPLLPVNMHTRIRVSMENLTLGPSVWDQVLYTVRHTHTHDTHTHTTTHTQPPPHTHTPTHTT